MMTGLLGLVLLLSNNGLKIKECFLGPEEMQKTVKKEYRICTEDGIEYVFQQDGILLVSGRGITKDFETLEEGQLFFATGIV